MAQDNEAKDKKDLNNDRLFSPQSNNNQNVADQASQNKDAELNKIPVSDTNDVHQDDNPDQATSENSQPFNNEDRNNTTAGSKKDKDYIGNDEPIEMGDDLDADIDQVRDNLRDEHTAIQKLNLNADDSLYQMRDILLRMNSTQTILYRLVNYYARNTMEYRKIKDNLVDSEDKDKLKSLLKMWEPLFKISDTTQVQRFTQAVNEIQEIVKDGSLDNLNRLAHYFNEKNGKIDISKVKSDTEKQKNHNDQSSDEDHSNKND